ncbi:MAG: PilZ domain-containing protein [Desulfopila sp.]
MKKQHRTAHDETTLRKAFVNEEGKATVICPNCSTVTTLSVGQLRERQHLVKIRCTCSHTFKINLDFRKCFRKPTSLEGRFQMTPPAAGSGMVKVSDLSLDGLCFETGGGQRLQVGQRGVIEFTLDNRKRTQLKRRFVVMTVSGNTIGCKFAEESAFEPDLGFYLRFGP